MQTNSDFTFNDIIAGKLGNFIKVVWNGRIIYNDTKDDLIIDGQKLPFLAKIIFDANKAFIKKYGSKKIYNFKCKIVENHHTELYIEGDK